MRILHTSDWHLGRKLYGRSRHDEFREFLDWLLKTIDEHHVDLLLVAGDIFDTSTPSNTAQSLYYRFLCNISSTCCKHVIIIGGNHDSPSFLNAPRELLSMLNVHVIGTVTDKLEDQIIIIESSLDSNRSTDSKNATPLTSPEAVIVCAVPYLRDRDIRTVSPGETVTDKTTKLIEGVKNHYSEIIKLAEQKRIERQKNISTPVPIIATGHLFAAGGQTIDGDGVRELYIGSLAHMGSDVFPTAIDYLALGHLHVPQRIAGQNHYRYSGSPIPMGFGEAKQTKQVVLLEFNETTPLITQLPVPVFQELRRVTGSLSEIEDAMVSLKNTDSHAWLEIEYTGSDVVGDLREKLHELVAGSHLEIRRIRNRQLVQRILASTEVTETLDDLDIHDVFQRCLDAHEIPEDSREELLTAYDEIVENIHFHDIKEAENK